MGCEVNGNSGKDFTWLDYQQWAAGMNSVLPMIGNVLASMPMPWVQNYFQHQWFPGASSGLLTTDQFQCSYAPTSTTSGGGVKPRTETAEDDTDLTPEERLRQNQEKAEKKAKILELVENYNSMYTLLENYGKSLTDKTTPTKTVFEETLATYKNKAKSNMTKEKLDTEIANIKAMYDTYADRIKEHELAEAKKGITSASDPTYKQKASSLKSAIANGTDSTFGVLKDGSWNNEVDVLELLSAWNGDNSFSKDHLAREILNKYKEATGEDKSELETLMKKLQAKLVSVAEDIDENNLTEETKGLLTGAIAQLQGFDSIEKQAHNIDNYNKSFDNLYRAIRLAKAEIAADELKGKFEFLGDNNPYKNPTFLSETKEDLEKEALTNKNTVSAAPASLTVKQRIQARTQYAVATIKCTKDNITQEFYVTVKEINSDNKATLIYYDKDEITKTVNDLTNAGFSGKITGVFFNPKQNGEYSIKYNDNSVKYYDANGNEITKEKFDGK